MLWHCIHSHLWPKSSSTIARDHFTGSLRARSIPQTRSEGSIAPEAGTPSWGRFSTSFMISLCCVTRLLTTTQHPSTANFPRDYRDGGELREPYSPAPVRQWLSRLWSLLTSVGMLVILPQANRCLFQAVLGETRAHDLLEQLRVLPVGVNVYFFNELFKRDDRQSQPPL